MNNLYNIVDTTEITPKDLSFIPAGIHDNTKIIDIKFDTTPFKVDFIEIKFEDSNGATGTASEREVTKGQLTDEEFAKKVRNQLARLEKIASNIIGEINTDPEIIKKEGQIKIHRFKDANVGGSFKNVFEWLYNIWKTNNQENLYRIKFVYNEFSGKYATLPKYNTYVWMEPMSIVDDGKSKIVKYGIDRFDEIIPDVEQKVDTSILNTDIESVEIPNELPF